MAKDQYNLATVATFLVTLIPSPFYFWLLSSLQ